MSIHDHQELTKKQRFWLNHLETCARTDQSLSRYAATHDLDRKAFYNWKSRLRRQGLLTGAAETVRGRQGSSPDSHGRGGRGRNPGQSPTRFIPLRLASEVGSTPALRIRFPNGIVVERTGSIEDSPAADPDLLSILAALP